MTNLDVKKMNRWKMLKKFYELTDGQASRHIISMWDVGNELGWDRETTSATYDYLQGERLLKGMTIGGGSTITHEGVKEVEEAEDNPAQPTQHFPSNITNLTIYGDNISVGQGNAVGRNTVLTNVNFNQNWDKIRAHTDLMQLANELALLRNELLIEAKSAEHYAAIGAISSAEIEAKNTNGPKTLEYLAKAGKWALDVATRIGVSLVADTIKQSMDI